MNMTDARRAQRRSPSSAIGITDVMTGQRVAHLGNVSETGMLLMASRPLREDALYQLQFTLPGHQAGGGVTIDAGVHLLWSAPVHTPGQSPAGLRILTVSAEHLAALREWVTR